MTSSLAQSNDKHNHPNSGQQMNSSDESDERTEPWVSVVSSSVVGVSLRPGQNKTMIVYDVSYFIFPAMASSAGHAFQQALPVFLVHAFQQVLLGFILNVFGLDLFESSALGRLQVVLIGFFLLVRRAARTGLL